MPAILNPDNPKDMWIGDQSDKPEWLVKLYKSVGRTAFSELWVDVLVVAGFKHAHDPWLDRSYQEQITLLQALLRTDVEGKALWARDDDPYLYDSILTLDAWFKRMSPDETYGIGHSFPRQVNRWMSDRVMLNKLWETQPEVCLGLKGIKERLR